MRRALCPLIVALAACGGDPALVLGDAGGDDDWDCDFPRDRCSPPQDACNPVGQTGCGPTEKCTWITIDSGNDLGIIGCVPAGTVAEAGDCTHGVDGETTGYDNCVAGQMCIGGICEAICTLAPDSCDAKHSCQRYFGLFETDPARYGACDYLCDPITQERADHAAACNSIDPTRPDKACYGSFDSAFHCDEVWPQVSCGTHGGTALPGDPSTCTDDNSTANFPMYSQYAVAYGPAGGVYDNGCAPGFGPAPPPRPRLERAGHLYGVLHARAHERGIARGRRRAQPT
jgi:hypothetical protein